jgi:hypothetical protein
VIALERLCLAARAVEREHHLAAEPLTERMLGDKRLQLAYELGVTSELEVSVDALLERDRAKFLEPANLSLCEGLEREVGKRRATPKRERIAKDRLPVRRRPLPGFRDQTLEAERVDIIAIGVQHVTGRAGDETVLA